MDQRRMGRLIMSRLPKLVETRLRLTQVMVIMADGLEGGGASEVETSVVTIWDMTMSMGMRPRSTSFLRSAFPRNTMFCGDQPLRVSYLFRGTQIFDNEHFTRR